MVFLAQVHGTRVATVAAAPDPDEPGPPGHRRRGHRRGPGSALAVLAADCVPVLLADPVAGVVGAAHAGRVGAAAGVLPATLAAMTALGARVDAVEVLLGPAICGGCYEVPAAMRAEVDAALPGSAVRTRRGTPGLDLRAGLYHQSAALGVARIGGDPRCTLESADLYSHRRRRPHRPAGRDHLAGPVVIERRPGRSAWPGPATARADSAGPDRRVVTRWTTGHLPRALAERSAAAAQVDDGGRAVLDERAAESGSVGGAARARRAAAIAGTRWPCWPSPRPCRQPTWRCCSTSG